AAMGFAVVNSMKQDGWGAFTLAATIPLAMGMGVAMLRGGGRAIPLASAVGVVGLFAAVIFGGWASALPVDAGPHVFLQRWFALGPRGVALAVAAYGFLASVLPVWLLLTPRDYLSSYL